MSTDPTEEVKPSVASKSKEEKKEDKEGEEGRHMSAKIFGDFMDSMTELCDKIVKDPKMPPKGTDADPGANGVGIKGGDENMASSNKETAKKRLATTKA